jgi:hypothetical protein
MFVVSEEFVHNGLQEQYEQEPCKNKCLKGLGILFVDIYNKIVPVRAAADIKFFQMLLLFKKKSF